MSSFAGSSPVAPVLYTSHALGLAEVGQRLGRKLRKLSLHGLPAGEVVGADEVAELVRIADAGQALLERRAPPRGLRAVVDGVWRDGPRQ